MSTTSTKKKTDVKSQSSSVRRKTVRKSGSVPAKNADALPSAPNLTNRARVRNVERSALMNSMKQQASYEPPQDKVVVPHVHGGAALRNYNVPGLQLYFNKANIHELPNNQTLPYWSDDLASVYVKSGSLSVVVDGDRVELHDKELCLIKPQTLFYLEGVKGKPANVYLGLTNESLFSHSNEFKSRYIDPIFHTPEPRFAIYCNTAPLHKPLVLLLRQIEHLISVRQPGFELVLVGKLHEYLYFVWSELGKSFFLPPAKKDPDADSFRIMHEFIRLNYAKNVSVQDICAAAGVSRNNCFAVFQRFTKTSPARFLNDYRLECARELLISTDDSLAKIAQSCGFSHQSHFGRNFNLHFGVTPLRFRREAKKAAQHAAVSLSIPPKPAFEGPVMFGADPLGSASDAADPADVE